MNKKKVLSIVLSLCIMIGLTSFAYAKKDNDLGEGQTEITIHIDGGKDVVAENNEEFQICIGDEIYNAVWKGNHMTIKMDSADNGFDIGKDEFIDIGYSSSKGSGTIRVTHQEGNGSNIDKEHDNGLNNFKGELNQAVIPLPGEDEDPYPTPTPEPDPPPTITDPEVPPVTPGEIPPVDPTIPESEKPVEPDKEPEIPPVIKNEDDEEIIIEDEEPPLAELPEVEEEEESEFEIKDGDVPLGELPQTGSNVSVIFKILGMTALLGALCAVIGVVIFSRKRNKV